MNVFQKNNLVLAVLSGALLLPSFALASTGEDVRSALVGILGLVAGFLTVMLIPKRKDQEK